ncbi:MAG: amidase [Acidimicrobiia bacterium]|nr:amidase [Acidimicrobiia bacterium]
MSDELTYLSATEALAMFRSRELAPLELLDAVMVRAQATEPLVNAFTDTYFEEARHQAEAAGEAYATGTARPLEGLPIAAKDEPRVDGRRWTQGSLLFENEITYGTDPITQRVLEAGGILHAHTTTPEFSMAIVTWTYLHGITRSPWNPALTSGGSSGGSGASLASGSSLLATGSDIAGSIRIPASMNGVVGFKPPWGRVPEFWPWNREPYAASGPMGRTVKDVILFENAISGPLVGDMFSSPPLHVPTDLPPVGGMRIAVSADLGYFNPDGEIVNALESTAAHLRELGAVVDQVDVAWSDQAEETALTHLSFQSRPILRGAVPDENDDRLTPYIREFLQRPPVSVEEWIESWRYADAMYEELQRKVFLAGYDALICPTLVTTSIPADLGHPESGSMSDLGDQLKLVMTYPFNILGRLPVVNVPIGLAPSTGVPIGMQIVGPVDADAIPFQVALGLEAEFGSLFEHHRPSLGRAE